MLSNKEPISILVADFGEAFITHSGPIRNKSDCIQYIAPERIDESISKVTDKSDLWSCGVIIYEMIHLELPFKDAKEILEKNYQPEYNDAKLSKDLKPLLAE